MSKKRVLLTAIGAPNKEKGYDVLRWSFDGEYKEAALPFMIIADNLKINSLLILGTDRSFNPQFKHFEQLQEALKKSGLNNNYSLIEIGSLKTVQEFWDTFKDIVRQDAFKNSEVELYVDLTFGYRTQPILIFLAAYFLEEMNPGITLKGIYYGMNNSEPPQILEMTELLELLQWIKAAQIFTFGGSGHLLSEKIRMISGNEHNEVARSFQEFIDAYTFNYIADLPAKALAFQKVYNEKSFRKTIRNHFPVFSLIHPYLRDFVKQFTGPDKILIQLQAANRNFKDGAYSRAALILRELYVSFLAEAFNVSKNEQRKKLERVFINRIFFIRQNTEQVELSPSEKQKAHFANDLLVELFGENDIDRFFKEWSSIREIRNNTSHIRTPKSRSKGQTDDIYYSKFKILKDQLENHLAETENLFDSMRKNLPLTEEHLKKVNLLMNDDGKRNLFVIVNEGLHPIIPVLKKQFGANIHTEVLTKGNVGLDNETLVAEKCRQIAEKYHDYKIYLVPSGFPYLAVTAFAVFQQVCAVYPTWLQYDRDDNIYRLKNLDPRQLLGK